MVTHDTTRFRGSGPRRMRISGELGGVGGGEGRSVCGPGGPVNGRVPHRSVEEADRTTIAGHAGQTPQWVPAPTLETGWHRRGRGWFGRGTAADG